MLCSPDAKEDIQDIEIMNTRSAALFVASLLLSSSGITTALNTNLLVPLYVYPSPGAWDHVYRAVRDHPSLQFHIVINPDSGPGPAASTGYDANWINATATLNAFPNVRTFGYVHLLHGAAPPQDVVANITAWASWSAPRSADPAAAANTSMAGVFFDETPAGATAYMQQLADAAHQQLGAAAHLVFNPGVALAGADADAAGYFALADHVVVSESRAATYTTAVPTANVPARYAPRASILVSDFAALGSAATRPLLQRWLRGMVRAGIGSVNVVDYGWDRANAADAPADIGSVADLLVQAQGGAGTNGVAPRC